MLLSIVIRPLTAFEMQITALGKVRDRVGLEINERGPQKLEVAAGVRGLSEIELNTFIDMAEARYRAKRMEPGEVAPCCHCPAQYLHAPALQCAFIDSAVYLRQHTAGMDCA